MLLALSLLLQGPQTVVVLALQRELFFSQSFLQVYVNVKVKILLT